MAVTAASNDSILDTIKKLLGYPDDDYFDKDIIIGINTSLSILTQLGVGPSEGFSISDNSTTWGELINDARLNDVVTYVHQKTRLIFDPPLSSSVADAMERTIKELEWRINVAAESIEEEG